MIRTNKAIYFVIAVIVLISMSNSIFATVDNTNTIKGNSITNNTTTVYPKIPDKSIMNNTSKEWNEMSQNYFLQFGTSLGFGVLGILLGNGIMNINNTAGMICTPLLCFCGVITGVELIGNLGDKTGSLLWTSLGGALGAVVGFGVGIAGLSLMDSVTKDTVMLIEVISIFLPTIGAMIGFNSTLTYKEGVNPVSVSQSLIPTLKGDINNTVYTLNIYQYSF